MDYRTPAEPAQDETLDGLAAQLEALPVFVDFTGECPVCMDYAIVVHARVVRGVRGHHPRCRLVR
jgi:hypothetical protein